MRKRCTGWYLLFTILFLISSQVHAGDSFIAFESGHVRPLALTPDGTRLLAVNTPDNHLELFEITASGLDHRFSIPVGMEPVAVAIRNDNEAWIINHLSDSVSIVDLSATPPTVKRTLLVGDEPRDIVFAGANGNRAFITTAHRGQNSPYNNPSNPGELTTPGIGRADVWVFDATNLGENLGGTPITILTLFGDTPRALSVTPDGSSVYAAVYKSGNRTTTINEGIVCNGGASAGPCTPPGENGTAPGGLPAPNADKNNVNQPETGLIVQFDGTHWVDELNRQWDDMVRFSLPDKDVFAIDANANPPVETASFSSIGTVLFNMVINPDTGKIYVANTEANNATRFEGHRPDGNTISTVQGNIHKSRITVIDPESGSIIPRHLNKHIDYSVTPAPAGTKEHSLAIPQGLAISNDGKTLYVAAKGSGKIGIFDTAQLENDSFTPDASTHVTISGGGPSGLVLSETGSRLYVFTRFDNGISIIDPAGRSELAHYTLHNPEPASITNGRRFLYDANYTSSNGEAACASCHIDGDKDELAWDLGDPMGSVLTNPNPFELGPNGNPDFHPMKGPMTTQTLRGMATHGPMHWRGDRTAGNDSGGDPMDEDTAFKKFNTAFDGLLGRGSTLTPTEMQMFTDFILQVIPPPNPIRALDDSLTPSQLAGRNFYSTAPADAGLFTCDSCHVLDPALGFFGTDGDSSFEGEPQHFKIAQLRNMYEKVGMFGMPSVAFFNSGDNNNKGDQIRGFGYMHDGSVDSLFRFLNASLFNFPSDTERRNVEQFLYAFDSNLKPVIGQQVTLTNSNANHLHSRIDLLIAQAVAGNSELIVKGNIEGQHRGWHWVSGDLFKSDIASESNISLAQLQTMAQIPGQSLTFTAVPVGTSVRMGIDRDEDNILDADDNCPAIPSSDQTDTDSDGQGNLCDSDDDNDGLNDQLELVLGTNPLLTDSDGDQISDYDEINRDYDPYNYTEGVDLNPLSDDTDNDGYTDQFDPIPLLFNHNDGDLAPLGNPDGLVNAADYLIGIRIITGLAQASDLELSHGDLYPVNAPDGVITMSDLILIMKLIP